MDRSNQEVVLHLQVTSSTVNDGHQILAFIDVGMAIAVIPSRHSATSETSRRPKTAGVRCRRAGLPALLDQLCGDRFRGDPAA